MRREVPIIVAKQSFLNQTGAVPLTAIFTPIAEGDFRVSFYVSVRSGSPNDSDVQLHYTDEIGNQQMITNFNAPFSRTVASLIDVIHSIVAPINLIYSGIISNPTVSYDLFVAVEEI